MPNRNIRLIPCLLLVLSSSVSAWTADWPQWRGPDRDGVDVDADWPDSLGEDSLQPTWSVKLGESYSGPVTAKGMVFVTETRNKKEEWVQALDIETGAVKWTAHWEGSLKVPFFARSNGSWIRATPATDGNTLLVAGIRDVLVALDVETGRQKWRLDFPAELKTELPAFGFASSPMIRDDAAYVQAGEGLTCVDLQTGHVRWRALQDGGGMSGSAFASPAFAVLDGHPQVLAQTRTTLAGVDPETGRVLWSHPIPNYRGMCITTPTVAGNRVFTSAYKNLSMLFDITRQEETWTATPAWTVKKPGYMSSPVVAGDALFFQLGNERLVSMGITDGDIHWTSRPVGKYASLVRGKDRILALTDRGELILFDASTESFRVRDRRKVSDEPSWAHLAVAGDRLLIRTLRGLTVFRWRAPYSSPNGEISAAAERPTSEMSGTPFPSPST